jgi:hypothetical protein
MVTQICQSTFQPAEVRSEHRHPHPHPTEAILNICLLFGLLQRYRSAGGRSRLPVPPSCRGKMRRLLPWRGFEPRTSSCPTLLMSTLSAGTPASQQWQWHHTLVPAPRCLWHCCFLARCAGKQGGGVRGKKGRGGGRQGKGGAVAWSTCGRQ